MSTQGEIEVGARALVKIAAVKIAENPKYLAQTALDAAEPLIVARVLRDAAVAAKEDGWPARAAWLHDRAEAVNTG